MSDILRILQSTIRRKGLIETCFNGMAIVSGRIYSVVRIFFYRLRGYDIRYSVSLGNSITLFQSTFQAIRIGPKTRLGHGTRITAGFDGKLKIGAHVLIDDHTYVMSQENIIIGNNVMVSSFCFITDFNHNFSDIDVPLRSQGYTTKPVHIGDNVWIGTHTVILPGVTIGKGCVIGAGSVVTGNIPEYSVAVGSPAKVIRVIRHTADVRSTIMR